MRKKASVVAGLAALGGLAGGASATLTLNDGNATYVNTMPTSRTATSGGSADLRPEGGTTTDHLFRNTWHWRVNGVDTREFLFSSEAGFGFAEAGSGTNTGTQSWTGLDGGRFNAVLTSVLTDGGAAGQALLVQTMAITNTSGGALDLALFNFADYDVAGSAGSDSALMSAADEIQITDGSNFARHRGLGGNAWQVTSFNTLFTALTNTTVGDLNNTGLPFGPGDYTGAWQWNTLSVGLGGTVTVTAVHAINQDAIPAPAALALFGLAAVGARRRRRS
jgi:MYXO-CTERM domain-containing protein